MNKEKAYLRNVRIITLITAALLIFIAGYYIRDYLYFTPHCSQLPDIAFKTASREFLLLIERWNYNIPNPYIHTSKYPTLCSHIGCKEMFHYEIVFFLIDGSVKFLEGECIQ